LAVLKGRDNPWMKWRKILMNKKQIEIPLRKRHNYAYGMVLGVEDFKQEQSYFIDRMKLHNRTLHGYGTISGLEVSSEDAARSIIVKAGTAIDPMGNEISLASGVRCPFPEKGETAYLVLYWAERETDPVPLPGSGDEGDQTIPSRVEEYAILKYELDQDGTKHAGVTLARLKKLRGKWKIDKKFRVRRAKPESK
jgi:hypothetical protein